MMTEGLKYKPFANLELSGLKQQHEIKQIHGDNHWACSCGKHFDDPQKAAEHISIVRAL